MNDLDLQSRFQENGWNPIDPNKTTVAREIANRLLQTVEASHAGPAKEGELYSIFSSRSHAEGLISKEGNEYVIRILSETVSILQTDCEEVVVFIDRFCRNNHKRLEWTKKIDIFETRNRNTVIEGPVLVRRWQRIIETWRNKRLELTIGIGGLITLIGLLIITYLYRDLNAITDTSLRWRIDIAGKLIGSASITTISSLLNALFFYNSLHQIAWRIPPINR